MSGRWVVDCPPGPSARSLARLSGLGALIIFHKREATPMADDADPDWHAGSMTYPVRMLFILFEGAVGGAIGYAAAFALDLSTMWTVVTVAALATLGATCEWEDTATLTVGLEKPRRADSIDQDALLEADAL